MQSFLFPRRQKRFFDNSILHFALMRLTPSTSFTGYIPEVPPMPYPYATA